MNTEFITVNDFSEVNGIVAIIPAAGIGQRMNATLPKQYLKINDKTILEITLEKFLSFAQIELVVIAISPEDTHIDLIPAASHEKVILIDGGNERASSVNNAFQFLADHGLPDNSAVMVHDAARPCITLEDLERLSAHYELQKKACFLAAPVIDTLHQVNKQKQVTGCVNRDLLIRAMTPQMACFSALKSSLESAIIDKKIITDEVSALIAAGHSVDAVVGRSDNIKVTTPDDLDLAGFYLNQQASADS